MYVAVMHKFNLLMNFNKVSGGGGIVHAYPNYYNFRIEITIKC